MRKPNTWGDIFRKWAAKGDDYSWAAWKADCWQRRKDNQRLNLIGEETMQFTPENAALVMAGKKTQTRRLVKANEHFTFRRVWGYVSGNAKKVRWQLGNTYAVQPGRGKRAIGRIRIVEIRRERAQDISEEDATAEGCQADAMNSARTYFQYLWDSIYAGQKGKQWTDNPELWALTFELVIGE